jgi:hypothetical protein
MLRKLIRLGVPLGMLLFALTAFDVVFANDSDYLQVPTTVITGTATLAQSAPVSYTLVNSSSHAMYYSATLDPSPGRCSKGLESPESLVWNGESKTVLGAIEARCYQQPGVYKHVLRIKQQAGPNDPNFTGENEFRIPVTVTVPSALQNFAWAGTMSTAPIVVGSGDPFTTTITMKNLQHTSANGQTRVRIYYEPTDGSLNPVITGDGSLTMNGTQNSMQYTWHDDLQPGEQVTMTIKSRGGPFVGAYPGSIVATLASGAEAAQGLIVLKSKPQIESVQPVAPIPGERTRLIGKNFLRDVPSGTSAHELFLIIADPQTSGVANVYADSEGVIWEDNSINFVLPKNLKPAYCYSVRVYRAFVFAVSEPFTLCTGQAPQPALQFGADLVPYQVAEGSLFTITLSISNTTSVTQTTVTTFSVGGGAVGEVVELQASHGEFFGFSSTEGVWASEFKATDDANLNWLVNVPPHTTAKLIAVVKAASVDAQTEFPGVFTWEIPENVVIGSVSIFPVITFPVMRVDAVEPSTVERGQTICLRGQFETAPGEILIDWQTPLRPIIVLNADLWSSTQICFGTSDLAAGQYGVRVTSGEYASNKAFFNVTEPEQPQPTDPTQLYLPLVQS